MTEQAATQGDRSPLPVSSAGLPRRRTVLAAVGLVVGLPGLTAVLVDDRAHLSYATPVLLVLTLVVLVALVGGLRVALPAALAGGLVLNWFFTPPFNTLVVDRPDQLLVLGVYFGVALVVSTIVDVAARRTSEATRARAEARALSSLAGATLAEEQTLPDLLDRVREVFRMREAALLERVDGGWTAVATTVRPPLPDGPLPDRPLPDGPLPDGPLPDRPLPDGEVELRVPAGADLLLVVRGPELFAADQRVLTTFADAAATALEGRRLAEKARAAVQIEAADRMRTALLAAVGHDLRTPLAGVKAAVSSLRQQDVEWAPSERDALLETIEESADRLQALVANLLDASRLQAGSVSAELRPVGLVEALDAVLLHLPAPDRDRVHVEIASELPDAYADAGLLERVMANVLDNALRHAPAGTIVTVRVHAHGGVARCDVIDHGPGVAVQHRQQVFAPFQRLGDRTSGGVGLGLAVARGFVDAMSGTITLATTPGGGLTIAIGLPLAPDPAAPP